jgi:hypothetical protein
MVAECCFIYPALAFSNFLTLLAIHSIFIFKMRLLSTHNWTLKEFLSDNEVPPYAILSHTWDKDEVTFQQWESLAISDIVTSDIKSMKGYQKIKQFGQKAASHGFDWVWVDTYAHLQSLARVID